MTVTCYDMLEWSTHIYLCRPNTLDEPSPTLYLLPVYMLFGSFFPSSSRWVGFSPLPSFERAKMVEFSVSTAGYSIVISSTNPFLSLTRTKATAERQKQGSNTCHIHAHHNYMGHHSLKPEQTNPSIPCSTTPARKPCVDPCHKEMKKVGMPRAELYFEHKNLAAITVRSTQSTMFTVTVC